MLGLRYGCLTRYLAQGICELLLLPVGIAV